MRSVCRAWVIVASTSAACGGEATGVSPSNAAVGSGEFYVHSYVPVAGSTAGASYDRKVTFTQTTCTSTRVGPCSVNPCAFPPAPDAGAGALPNAGPVTIDGAQMPPVTLDPHDDGTYTPVVVDGQLPWTMGGAPVTFQWAHLPGDANAAGGSVTLSTPPYIALAPGSAFAETTPTVTRSQDLTVSWTSDGAPDAADQVAVDLNLGSTQVVCIFSVSAGTGIVPKAALGMLDAGAGTFNVHSKQNKTLERVDGTGWTLGFNVDAQARASYGLAMGPVHFR